MSKIAALILVILAIHVILAVLVIHVVLVILVILVLVTRLGKMKMMSAIHEYPNNSKFVIQDLIATFHRVVVVVLVRFPGCRDYPFLLDV